MKSTILRSVSASCVVVAGFLLALTCTRDSATVSQTTTADLRVVWNAGAAAGLPAGVDSVRITISSAEMPSAIVRTFAFTDNAGTVPAVPVGISSTIGIEGFSATGTVLYSGSVTVAQTTASSMEVVIDESQVTPLAPSDPIVQVLSPNAIRLMWTDNAPNELYYIVNRFNGTTQRYDSIGSTTLNFFVDSSLQPGTGYRYTVVAVNSAGYSPATSPASDSTRQAAPANVTAKGASWTSIVVTWDPVAGASGYIVHRSDKSVPLDTVQVASFTDTGLTMCIAYEYQVAARTGSEVSPLSSVASAMPVGSPVKGRGILVEKPNGCETYEVGDTMRVDWELDSIKDGLPIKFSSDDGMSFVIIGSVLRADSNYMHGPHYWVIPDSVFSADGSGTPTVSDQCRIRINEYWATSLRDESDYTFRIRPKGSR